MKLLVLPGDGIGPEIVAATVSVLAAAGERFGFAPTFERAAIGFEALGARGTTFPEAVTGLAREADAVILGPVSHDDYPAREEGGLNPSGELRRRLDLYANIRPARTVPGLPPRCGAPVDLVIVRENTEGFYADRSMHLGPGEFMPDPDLALAVRKVSRRACLRIARAAFALAGRRRGRVTAVHKANVLRVSDGLFLDCARQVAAEHPAVAYDENLIDSMAALLVRDPSPYDVIVTTNMYGDILSDLAAEIAGGLGMAASINAGAEHCVAQAQHGSAPALAGRGVANPASLVGSAALMLRWLGERGDDPSLLRAADAIGQALDSALSDPRTRTADLGGTLSTDAFARAVIAGLDAVPA